MALNSAEKLVLGMIINCVKALNQEDELSDFLDRRQAFRKDAPRDEYVEAVNLQRLHTQYPDFTLTKKLVEVSQLVLGFLAQQRYQVPTMGRRSFAMHAPNDMFDMKMSLLEQNGIKFEYFDQRAVEFSGSPGALEQLQKDEVTAFALKVKDVFIDFNLYIQPDEIKGVGTVEFNSTYFVEIRDHRADDREREMKPEEYERRVIHAFTGWATNQALNFLQQAKHLRRLNKPLRNLVIRLDAQAVNLPKPEVKEEPQPKPETTQAGNCEPQL